MAIIWTSINANELVSDQPQCDLDIVGDGTPNPADSALFIGRDNTDPNSIWFRMRLRCIPLEGPTLSEKVWGFLIKDALGNPQYTVVVNNKSGNAIQVYTALNSNKSKDAFDSLVCGQAIDQTLTTNVQLTPAGTTFGGGTNYFIDFKVPSCLNGAFFDQQHIYCGLTSADVNNINFEVPPPYEIPKQFNQALCGGVFPPPVGNVTISKSLSDETGTTCPIPRAYTVTITVTNNTGAEITVDIRDAITPRFVITDGSPDVRNFPGVVIPNGESRSRSFTVQGYFNTAGTYSFNMATALNSTTGVVLAETILPNVVVTPCRGLQFS